MLEILIWSTGGVVLLAMSLAYLRSGDPLHPMMFLGPMMFYIFCFAPARIVYAHLLGVAFPDPSQVVFAQAVVLVSVAALCAGTLVFRTENRRPRLAPIGIDMVASRHPEVLKRLRTASYLLAGVAIASFLYKLSFAGGLISAFSRVKGGGFSPSGYISEATLLSVPAVMLLVLSRPQPRMSLQDLALTTLFIAPQLIQGALGARRGPLFIGMATLGFAWLLGRARRPSLRAVVGLVLAAGLGMMIVITHRQDIYIGSHFDFSSASVRERILPTKLNANDTSPTTWRVIIASSLQDFHFDGRRFLVQLLVRPIPKQLWPGKYEQTTAFVGGADGPFGLAPDQWYSSVGAVPELGTAVGFPADAFLEFGWGGAIVAFFMGLLYSYIWQRGTRARGRWTVIYLEACAVSVYVATQGIVSAWLYRLLLLAVPTWLLWELIVPEELTFQADPPWAGPAGAPSAPVPAADVPQK